MADGHTDARARADKAQTKAAEAMTSGVDSMMKAGMQPALMLKAGADLMEHWVETSQLMAHFYADRMKANLAAMGALAQCRTPVEFMRVWTDNARRTLHDYADAMDRAIEINATTK